MQLKNFMKYLSVHVNKKLILIQKAASSQNLLFFSTSRSGAELALEKQRLGENCQIFKATGSQKFERNINT